jgi:hypothetical protein
LQQLNDAEQNYPTHKKELLAIVQALKKWRFHLLGTHFEVHVPSDTGILPDPERLVTPTSPMVRVPLSI